MKLLPPKKLDPQVAMRNGKAPVHLAPRAVQPERISCMRPLLTHGFYVSFIAIAMSTGCTSVSPSKNGRAPVDLQHQHAVALSVGRYVAILQAIDEGNLDEVKSDIDWWIDLSIIELLWIEELQPDGDWGSVQLPYSSLTMRGFYRSIAHFRRDHPRRHAIPLDAETLKLIEKFVQKYQ